MVKLKYFGLLLSAFLALIIFKGQILHDDENIIVDSDTVIAPCAIQSVIDRYDSILSVNLDSFATVGAAVAIVYKGEVAFLKCYGVKKAGENDPINKHTIFRLASVSKTVTGMLAGILSGQGLIDLDEKVVESLPDFRLKDSVSTSQLSIKNILSHTSGLVPHAFDNLVEEGVPINNIINRLDEVIISAAPGVLYGYQNVVFSLFDTITAIKTNNSISESFITNVFEPMKMGDASTGFAPFYLSDNKAYPHNRRQGEYKATPLNNRYYNTLSAAGVNASISDMSNYLISILNNDSNVFKSGVVDSVLKPQVRSPLKRVYFSRWDKVDDKHYAMGWRIIQYKGSTLAYHGGYVQGYRAEIALCREDSLGIVYLSNSPNRVASLSIPSFLNLYFQDSLHQKEELTLSQLK